MTETSKDPLGIGHWPRWKQITVSTLVIVAGIGALEYAKATLDSSPEAKTYKAKMGPLAEQLLKAQQMGDKPTVLALAQPTVNIVDDYNALSDERKTEINKLPLRYCVLAAVHLSSGPVEVLQTGTWTSKPQYEAALDACN